MKLAIVGSVNLAGNPEAYSLIFHAIQKWKPSEIISGGAAGIDSMAVEVARFLNIPYREFKPDYQAWPAFKKRNLKIAKECGGLVRIYSSTSHTFGSGWCKREAEKRGKPTEEYMI